MNSRRFLIFLFVLCLSACSTYQTAAPVQDIDTHVVGGVLMHRVQSGETLYAIAWRYDKDYQTLAALNHLPPPYRIHLGQDIRLTGHVKPLPKKKAAFITSHKKIARQKLSLWQWPVRGKVIRKFHLPNSKGVDISGHYGQFVLATQSGQIVYAGNGIRGYGQLIIIKHNDHYLSAYAYNSQLLIKQAQSVKAGQKIAKMGVNDRGEVKLHFEIRKNGKPVNPLYYLGSRRV